MPTKKPVVQIVIDDIYFQKLKTLGDKEEKKPSAIGRKIIENYIDKYEDKNGTIKMENPQ